MRWASSDVAFLTQNGHRSGLRSGDLLCVIVPSAIQSHGSRRVEGWSSVTDFILPATRYALSDDVNIAYQTMGDGPIDLIMVPGIVSHIEFFHEFAGYTAFLRRLANSPASSRLTRGGRVCPTEYPAPLRSSNGWTTFVL
jgi:hypothetical protein